MSVWLLYYTENAYLTCMISFEENEYVLELAYNPTIVFLGGSEKQWKCSL